MSDDQERDRELNRRIRELCDARGWHFKPWLPAPYLVTCNPEPPKWATGPWRARWPAAARLRRELLAELKAEGV